jgi:hypothetical protein
MVLRNDAASLLYARVQGKTAQYLSARSSFQEIWLCKITDFFTKSFFYSVHLFSWNSLLSLQLCSNYFP